MVCRRHPHAIVAADLLLAEARARADVELMADVNNRLADIDTAKSVPVWLRRLSTPPKPNYRGIGRRLYNVLREEFSTNFVHPWKDVITYQSRVSLDQLLATFDAIEELCPLGWGYKTQLNRLLGYKTTYLYRSATKHHLYIAYKAMSTMFKDPVSGETKLFVKGQAIVGRHTFFEALGVATRPTKREAGISYYLEAVLQTLDEVGAIVNRIVALSSQLKLPLAEFGIEAEHEIQTSRLQLIVVQMREGIGAPIFKHSETLESECSGEASHCTRLSMSECSAKHHISCSKCAPLFYGPSLIKAEVDGIFRSLCSSNPQLQLARSNEQWTVYDELVSVRSALPLLSEQIKAYHAHVNRGRWQQAYLNNQVEHLEKDKMIVKLDYMMKYVCMCACECMCACMCRV